VLGYITYAGIRALARSKPGPPAVMRYNQQLEDRITDGEARLRVANRERDMRRAEIPPAFGERQAAAVVPAGSKRAARRAEAEAAEFAEQLREALGEGEKYLRFAGTLKNEEGEEYFGWGDDRQLWAALLFAAAASCRLRCKVEEHEHDGDAGELAWQSMGRLWFFAVPPKEGEGAGSKFGEGSGKSFLAELTDSLCPYPSRQVVPTGPGLARILGIFHGTPLLDESGLLFGRAAERKVMVMSLLLDGFTRGGETTHAWGKGINANSTFGPVILAANASMKANDSEQMAMLLSRMFSIEVIQAPKGFRPPRLSPGQRDGVKAIGDRLLYLMSQIAPQARDMQALKMPSWMSSRQADAWEPLFLVAGLAGGEWPERVVRAAEWMGNEGREKAKREGSWAAAMEGMSW
jgi:Protein of unknown function (DUF3631)